MPHNITARDVPEARQDFVDWARGRGGELMQSQGAPPGLGLILAASAAHAELFYVTADMTALARQIGQGLDVYALSTDDLPAQHGLLVWGEPATSEQAGAAPIGVAWQTSGHRLVVSLLGDAAAYRQWCDRYSQDTMDAAPLVSFGPLTYRGKGPTLRLDQPDRAWSSLSLGDHEEATRTLLATLILIRQPVEARRSLHEVEEVAASRASQKRIARAGGDPARTVRYVTLRQSLRPPEAGEPAGEYARRVYRHRWFVKAHRARQYYPSTGEHQTIWRGPYLVVPAGCEDAPIIGGERVNVLRR